jgi:hypothetical protein
MNLRRISTVLATATAGLVLFTACSSGEDCSDSNSNAASTANAVIVSSTPTIPSAPIAALPATGTKRGVVSDGKSVGVGGSYTATQGISYLCANGYKAVILPYNGSIEYNGVAISYIDEMSSGYNGNNGQNTVNVTFNGPTTALDTFKSQAVSFIAGTQYSIAENSDDMPALDQQVVNMTPSMVSPTGIILRKLDFIVTGYIGDLTFCLKQ